MNNLNSRFINKLNPFYQFSFLFYTGRNVTIMSTSVSTVTAPAIPGSNIHWGSDAKIAPIVYFIAIPVPAISCIQHDHTWEERRNNVSSNNRKPYMAKHIQLDPFVIVYHNLTTYRHFIMLRGGNIKHAKITLFFVCAPIHDLESNYYS